MVTSETLQVDRDIRLYLMQLGQDIGSIHLGDLFVTSPKILDRVMSQKLETGQERIRFSLLYSDKTADDKDNPTRAVVRVHEYTFEVYMEIDKANAEASYVERRRLTALVLDHLASTNREGRVIDVIQPGVADSEVVDINGHLGYQITFNFIVVETAAREYE